MRRLRRLSAVAILARNLIFGLAVDFWLALGMWSALGAIGPYRTLVAFAANGGFEPTLTDATVNTVRQKE